jgi:hypothetical protein
MKKKFIFVLMILLMATSLIMSQDLKFPSKGNDYITFGYTPFVSDVKPIETTQDPNLVTVGYGKYITNDLQVEGNFGLMAKKNYTSYAIGGNVYYNFPVYYKVNPFLIGGLTFTGINEVGTVIGTINQNVLGLGTGLGVNYYLNENLCLSAYYKLEFQYWMKPTVNGVKGTDEYFNLATGIGKIGVSVFW